MIEECKKLNPAGIYEFVQGDLSVMKSVKSIASQIASKVDKINYLCITQGFLSLKSKYDTEEGIDRKLALHYYSRYSRIVKGLMEGSCWGICYFPSLRKQWK